MLEADWSASDLAAASWWTESPHEIGVRMTRTVLWDLDGTIADTAQAHFAAWQETMAAEGVEYPYTRFVADFGRNNDELLPELLGPAITPARIQTISRHKEAAFRHYLHQGYGVRLLPGVLDWLERFERAGFKQAIGSSGPMANIVAIVEKLEIADYFHGLLTGLRLPRGKPDPAIFLNLASALEVEPVQCIVIEDTTHGIEAARRAGMASIAVGAVAANPGLDKVLAANPGRTCLRVAQLSDLSWKQVEALWDA
jgi:HAD superfamily hydrolase (TIGR01509 family)